MKVFPEHPELLLPLLLCFMSIILFIMMGSDKRKAGRHGWRTPEKKLFFFAIFGGAAGGTLGMYIFRHKTRHWYFVVFFPLLAILQIALCVWILAIF